MEEEREGGREGRKKREREGGREKSGMGKGPIHPGFQSCRILQPSLSEDL
jgi:hypothetical protein